MLTYPFSIVDVFAEAPYTGNQLAVIRGNPDDATMQKLALEMNYSETTFIVSDAPRDGGYDVRIFTPVHEVPFAGHPTLGTADVIRRELLGGEADEIVLNLKVGPIRVTFGADGVAWMRQNPPHFGHIYAADDMAAALNLAADDIDTRYPIQEVSTGLPFIIVPLVTLDAVRRARCDVPRFTELVRAGRAALGATGVLLFAPEPVHAEHDLHARVFVHLHGVPEDPATGSANGDLAGWLVRHRYGDAAHVDVRVEQGYEINRPSLLLLRASDAGDQISVEVGGRVFPMAQGHIG